MPAWRKLSPGTVALLSLVIALLYALWRLAAVGWDPVELAMPGSRFLHGDPQGTEGYDGQFALYIALDPEPETVSARLDVPSYRYQRILYPLLARGLALGTASLIPWALLIINLVAHAAGSWAVSRLVSDEGLWAGYGLIYGGWVGLVASAGLDLNEPLAFALLAAAWLALKRERPHLGAVLLALSMLTKETGVLFWAAAFAGAILQRGRRREAFMILAALVPFLLWQATLVTLFGVPGLRSGGIEATPFEWIPFMGLLRVGLVDLRVLALYLVIFGPSIVVPTLWAILTAGRAILAGRRDRDAWALLLNSAAILFLPFSIFREPLGLVRVASGLVLSVIYFAASLQRSRSLNLGLFWIALLALALSG